MHEKYIIRDSSQLNIDFYKGFQEDFLYNKALTLISVIDKQQEFFKIAEIKTDNEKDVKKYIESLNAEIYFSEIHQAEVLFALMFALLQDLPHWLYLTVYKTKDIKEKVNNFINNDIKKLTDGKLKISREFIKFVIYFNFILTDKVKADNWDKNIDTVIWLLQRIGRKYLEAGEYNAYKHGLRVFTGETAFFISSSDSPEQKTCIGHSRDSLTYLELKNKGEEGITAMKTTKHFNPLESINHLFVMSRLLETMKITRLAKIQKDTKGIKLNTFFEINRTEFQKLAKKTIFSITA